MRQVAFGGWEAFVAAYERVVRPMTERMEAGTEPLPDDLDRFVSINLFFEAAALLRASTEQHLSLMPDQELERVAMCLGLSPSGIERRWKGPEQAESEEERRNG